MFLLVGCGKDNKVSPEATPLPGNNTPPQYPHGPAGGDGSIYHSWRFQDVNYNGVTLRRYLTFAADSVINTTVCYFRNNIVPPIFAKTKAQARVGNGRVDVDQNQSSDHYGCTASLTRGSHSYVINGNTLTITFGNGEVHMGQYEPSTNLPRINYQYSNYSHNSVDYSLNLSGSFWLSF